MSKTQSRKAVLADFFAELDARGLTYYGAVIETSVVHSLLGIEMPAIAPKSEYDRLGLQELQAMDYVRGELLKVGRYIAGTPSGYRVLLPSENQKQVEQYIGSASKKLNRAQLLSRNTPVEFKQHDQTQARVEMMRSGMRSRFTADQNQPYL